MYIRVQIVCYRQQGDLVTPLYISAFCSTPTLSVYDTALYAGLLWQILNFHYKTYVTKVWVVLST